MNNFSNATEKAFFEFIYKRQLIWYRRFVLKEPAPWTDDSILQTYKFINMYRELDRCTIYLLDRLKNMQDRHALFLNIIFFRFFNLSGLYEMLEVEPFERMDSQMVKKLIKRFSVLKKNGKTIFNNAYVISPGQEQQPKHISILNHLFFVDTGLDQMIQQLDECAIPEKSMEILLQIPLAGPFLCCEIWTDLTYFEFFLQGWNDNDFVNIGPGARWGLNILYGNLSKREQQKKLYHLYMRQHEILKNIHTSLNEPLPWETIAYQGAMSHVPFLSITNIEGALCEFRKYWNLSQGKGRKRYYKSFS